MTKKLLVIASSLLFIAGCQESELDRCIEANTSKFVATHSADEEPSDSDISQMSHPLIIELDEKGDKFFRDWREKGCETGENESDSCNARREDFLIANEAEWLEVKEIVIQDIKLARKAAVQESAKNFCNAQGIY